MSCTRIEGRARYQSFAYAAGVDDDLGREAAMQLLRALALENLLVPVQVLGELYAVLLRKGRSRQLARDAVLGWSDIFEAIPTSPDVLLTAVDLATDHRLAIWDAIILAAVSRAGCRVLLSEDMQNGFSWGGVTIVDPFASPPHPLLEDLRRF